MSPDQATLERIKKVKEEILSSEKMLEENIMRRIGRTEGVASRRSRIKSVSSLVKEGENNKLSKEKRVDMGNRYMKSEGNRKRVKTENKNNDTIEENP
jgi:hypothetical protein